jgi:hypothetical protein
MEKAPLSKLAKQNDGWRYILTVADTFSKFLLVCAPLRSKTLSVIVALLHEAFCIYGAPEVLLGDREFDKADVHLLCLKWGVTHKATLAHDKSRTGSIERANLSVRLFLQNRAVQENSPIWHTCCSQLLHSYNTKIHSAIRMTPFEAFYRRSSATDLDAVIRNNTNKQAEKMVAAYQRSYGIKMCQVFDVTDRVLVATRTDAAIKALGAISVASQRKKNLLTAWSKKSHKILDKRRLHPDDQKKKLTKKQQLLAMTGVNTTKKGEGSRAWWKTATKKQKRIALDYRYLVNGKWMSGLDLLYVDPATVYIPPKQAHHGDGWYGVKLRSSVKAQMESKMTDAQLRKARAADSAEMTAATLSAHLKSEGILPAGFKLAVDESVPPVEIQGNDAEPIAVVPDQPKKASAIRSFIPGSLFGFVNRAFYTKSILHQTPQITEVEFDHIGVADNKKNKDYMSLGPAEKALVPLQYSFPTKYVDVVRSFTMTNAREYQFSTLDYAEVFRSYSIIRYAPGYWFGVKTKPAGHRSLHVTGRMGKDFPDTEQWRKYRKKYAEWFEVEVKGGAQIALFPRVTLEFLMKLHAGGGKVTAKMGMVDTKMPMGIVTLPGKAP